MLCKLDRGVKALEWSNQPLANVSLSEFRRPRPVQYCAATVTDTRTAQSTIFVDAGRSLGTDSIVPTPAPLPQPHPSSPSALRSPCCKHVRCSLIVQLGLNDTKDRGDSDGDVGDLLPEVNIGNGRYAVQITAGLRHTAAILDDQTVRGWGYNAKGQLGVGTVESVGDEQNEMGDNLAVTELGTVDEDDSSLELVEIHAGGWHTCAIFEGDLLKCWGEDHVGAFYFDP